MPATSRMARRTATSQPTPSPTNWLRTFSRDRCRRSGPFGEPRSNLPRLQSREMADALYLSLWYPNLRFTALGEKLTTVLAEFAKHGGESVVYSTTVWPVNWHEAP